MKPTPILLAGLALMACSAEPEFEIDSSDVPEAVMTAFKAKYPQATEVQWEVEKEDGKLYFEAEFKVDGKEDEAAFRPDGTMSAEEDD